MKSLQADLVRSLDLSEAVVLELQEEATVYGVSVRFINTANDTQLL